MQLTDFFPVFFPSVIVHLKNLSIGSITSHVNSLNFSISIQNIFYLLIYFSKVVISHFIYCAFFPNLRSFPWVLFLNCHDCMTRGIACTILTGQKPNYTHTRQFLRKLLVELSYIWLVKRSTLYGLMGEFLGKCLKTIEGKRLVLSQWHFCTSYAAMATDLRPNICWNNVQVHSVLVRW
jgi:hypothetical protein